MNISAPLRVAFLSFLLLGTASSALAAETLYRWKDSQGNLVVSDRPPEDRSIDFESVRMGANAMTKAFPPPAEGAPRSTETNDAPVQEDQAGSDPMSRVERPEKDPERCKTARENLEALETFARIRTKDDKGEYYYLTEEEKELQREQAREVIRVHCE